MTYSLKIHDRFRSKKIWECAALVTQAVWTTQRLGAAGTLRFTLLKKGGVTFFEGDPVIFSVDEQTLFSGYVFTKNKSHQDWIEVICYDQLRYLKAKQSYVFTGLSASDICKRLANELELQLGTIETTDYIIPSLICQGKSGLDILTQALTLTYAANSRLFTLFDEAGKLCLCDVANRKTSFILTEGSFITGYRYQTDIDSDTYNAVKLIRADARSGLMCSAAAEDTATQKKWGKLIFAERIQEPLNQAQLNTRAQTILKNHNRTLRNLTITALGIPSLRAGQQIYLKVDDLGDIGVSDYVLLERVEHQFAPQEHTMTLETRALDGID